MLNHYETLSVIGIQYNITLSRQGTLYNKHYVEHQRYFEAILFLLLFHLLGLIVIVPNFIFHLINGDMDTSEVSCRIIMFALWSIGANCLYNIHFKKYSNHKCTVLLFSFWRPCVIEFSFSENSIIFMAMGWTFSKFRVVILYKFWHLIVFIIPFCWKS